MEMCYAGAIAMPSSYVVMNEEEMTYTEGGGLPKYYINHDTCVNIMLTLVDTTRTVTPAVVAAALSTVGVKGITAFFAMIPGIGWAIGGYIAAAVINSSMSFSSALCEAYFDDKGMEVTLGFRWFTPYIKCKVK